jgi:hypothetical protein
VHICHVHLVVIRINHQDLKQDLKISRETNLAPVCLYSDKHPHLQQLWLRVFPPCTFSEETISIVETNPERFRINQDEIANRKAFTQQTRQTVKVHLLFGRRTVTKIERAYVYWRAFCSHTFAIGRTKL